MITASGVRVPMRSMPAITRLSYFDVALHALGSDQPPTVDAVRQAIGRHVEELSLRGEARLTKDVNDPGSFRNTAVDVLREMIRWRWIEPTPLADAEAAFEMIRHSPVPLTKAGVDAAKASDAVRREMIGVLALRTNQLLSEFLEWLQTYDLAIPEWSDGDFRTALSGSAQASPAEVTVLAVMACDTYGVVQSACASTYGRRLPSGPGPEFVAKHVTAFLEKRFGKRAPKTHKELVGAAGAGLVAGWQRRRNGRPVGPGAGRGGTGRGAPRRGRVRLVVVYHLDGGVQPRGPCLPREEGAHCRGKGAPPRAVPP
jgi:hypothetical protein